MVSADVCWWMQCGCGWPCSLSGIVVIHLMQNCCNGQWCFMMAIPRHLHPQTPSSIIGNLHFEGQAGAKGPSCFYILGAGWFGVQCFGSKVIAQFLVDPMSGGVLELAIAFGFPQ